MSDSIITVDRISKRYRLGQIGMSSLRESAERFFDRWRSPSAKTNGQPVPGLNQQPNNKQRTTCSPDSQDFWALRDVSFEVKRGEVLGVIGRNGAGKSTLLKLLSRITEPTSGRAILRGRVASLLEVGTGFHPELTGRENIFLNGAILGMRKAEITAKFDEIVAFSEIEKFIDTPVKRYSSGMYVRLAFAVAAHLDPEILLIDEVLAVGDATFQKKCLGKMGDVAKAGRTVLFVSHNMVAVQAMCNRSILLHQGRLANAGPSHQMILEYLQLHSKEKFRKNWEDNPLVSPDGQVRLKEVRIAPLNPEEKAITVKTALSLTIVFQNFMPNSRLNISVVVYSLEGVCIFNTGSPARIFSESSITGTCTIPGDLLNDGTYSIRVLIVKDTSICLIDEANTVMFDVHDVAREGAWHGKWIGAVRPRLDWQLDSALAETRGSE